MTGEPAYVITSDFEDDGEQLYWSNDDGWGARETATVFTQAERDHGELPMGAKGWVPSVLVEEGEYTVEFVLTNVITFSPIERPTRLSLLDAIANAYGTLPDGFFDPAEAEGWSVEARARRVL